MPTRLIGLLIATVGLAGGCQLHMPPTAAPTVTAYPQQQRPPADADPVMQWAPFPWNTVIVSTDIAGLNRLTYSTDFQVRYTALNSLSLEEDGAIVPRYHNEQDLAKAYFLQPNEYEALGGGFATYKVEYFPKAFRTHRSRSELSFIETSSSVRIPAAPGIPAHNEFRSTPVHVVYIKPGSARINNVSLLVNGAPATNVKVNDRVDISWDAVDAFRVGYAVRRVQDPQPARPEDVSFSMPNFAQPFTWSADHVNYAINPTSSGVLTWTWNPSRPILVGSGGPVQPPSSGTVYFKIVCVDIFGRRGPDRYLTLRY